MADETISPEERAAKKRAYMREYFKKWREKNKEKRLEYERARYRDQKERLDAYKAEWTRENPERHQSYCRKWRDEKQSPESKQRSRDKRKQHKIERPDLNQVNSRNYHARKTVTGSHTAGDIAEIRAAQKDRCAYCRVGLNGKGHVDHITPVSRGGSNDRRNLQILCVSCNTSKNAKDPIAFAQSRGLLV